MTPTVQGRGPAEPVWTVASVARRVGVAPATLRSWSLRYGIGPAGHHPGQHRRYTDADVAELDRVRALVEQGMPLNAAAALARDQRSRAAGSDPHPRSRSADRDTTTAGAAADTVHDLVQIAHRLDLAAAAGLIEASLAARGVPETWEQVCRPALTQLDAATSDTESCIGPALLLGWTIATCLRRIPTDRDAPTGPTVLLACANGEQHTLALDALFAALGERGLPVRMLGASVPASALADVATQLQPAVVVVWSQRPITAKTTVLRKLTGHTDLVVAAGPGWDPAALPTPARYADSLATALDLVAIATAHRTAAARRGDPTPAEGVAGPAGS